jgi:hypothetical protein
MNLISTEKLLSNAKRDLIIWGCSFLFVAFLILVAGIIKIDATYVVVLVMAFAVSFYIDYALNTIRYEMRCK